MENIDIYDHASLVTQIQQLRTLKKIQEEELKNCFSEFVDSLNPVTLVKKSLHDLADNKEVQFDLAKVALNTASNLVIDSLFGKYKSIKGFLSAVMVEGVSNNFINNSSIKVLSFFKKKKPMQAPVELNDK